MIGELTVGKRYRVTLRSRTFQGHLEGTLRATDLPRGALGNEDGQHCIWLSGEVFEWFLRLSDIATIEAMEEPPRAPARAPRPRPCVAVRHALRRRGLARAPRVDREAPEPIAGPMCRLYGRHKSV